MDPFALALLWAPLLSFVAGQIAGYTTGRWWLGLLIGLGIALLLAMILPQDVNESIWPPIYPLAGLLGGGTGRSFRRRHEQE